MCVKGNFPLDPTYYVTPRALCPRIGLLSYYFSFLKIPFEYRSEADNSEFANACKATQATGFDMHMQATDAPRRNSWGPWEGRHQNCKHHKKKNRQLSERKRGPGGQDSPNIWQSLNIKVRHYSRMFAWHFHNWPAQAKLQIVLFPCSHRPACDFSWCCNQTKCAGFRVLLGYYCQ